MKHKPLEVAGCQYRENLAYTNNKYSKDIH